MSNLRWSLAALLAGGLPGACADPCLDDGLGQENPPTCPFNRTDDSNGSTTGPATPVDTTGTTPMDTTMGSMSGSQSGTGGTADTSTGSSTEGDTDTDTDADTDADTDTDGGTLWCVDADGDGHGDPNRCQSSDEPIDGSVDNGDDCDDSDPNTFPGAAPNDDPRACMKDTDGDDWGDDDPPAGVEAGTDCLDDAPEVFPGAAENELPPDLCAADADDDGWGDLDPPPGAEAGTDCDDTDPNAHPGAAPNEVPPDLCTVDADGDGWGDANPGGIGPMPGSDCYDGNADLNPGTLQLTAFMPYQGAAGVPRTIATIDPTDASLATFVTLFGAPNANVVTAAMNGNGEIYANDLASLQLHSVDYAATCMMGTGTMAPVGMPYGMPGDIVCGLEFGGNGMLYGIDYEDQLLTFDPVSGQITGAVPLTMAGGATLDIASCGMAWDCTEDRLLVANGLDESIYSVEPGTGVVTLLRDLSAILGGSWVPVGLEYDPVSRDVFLSIGTALVTADLDSMDPFQIEGSFTQSVSNLAYLPQCAP